MDKLTHFDSAGNAIMVDVSAKPETAREAVAVGKISVNEAVFAAIEGGTAKKGDVLGLARVAGIMAAKRTSDLIPLCHPLPISKIEIGFTLNDSERSVTVECRVGTTYKTGVEMEALTGASVALLTIYDMCKALDRAMVIDGVRLMAKSGGSSGDYRHV